MGEFASLAPYGTSSLRLCHQRASFTSFTLLAALAERKGVVTAALVILLLYHGETIVRSAVALVHGGGWTVLQSKAPKED